MSVAGLLRLLRRRWLLPVAGRRHLLPARLRLAVSGHLLRLLRLLWGCGLGGLLLGNLPWRVGRGHLWLALRWSRRSGLLMRSRLHIARIPRTAQVGALTRLGRVEFKVLFGREIPELRGDVSGKDLSGGIVFAHIGVVETAGCRDTVFSVHNFLLCLQEVLIRLQFGVLFLHHNDASNSLGQLTFGLPLGRVTGLRVLSSLHRHGTCLCDLHQSGVLRPGGLLHHVHQIVKQVVATLQFDIDLCPRLLRYVSQTDQLIVTAHHNNCQNNENRK